MADVLFPEPSAERLVPWQRGEPLVHLYSRSTLPEAIEARRNVNAWYQAFPDVNGQLAAKLRSERDVDHEQSADELYVHHLLVQLVDEVRYEEDGGPDFRLYDDGRMVGSVEVVSMFECMPRQRDRRSHDMLAAEVSRLLGPMAGWLVALDLDPVQFPARPPPSARELAKFLEEQFQTLPPSGSEASALPDEFGVSRRVTYRPDRGAPIYISFMPAAVGAQAMNGADAHLIIGPIIGRVVGKPPGVRLCQAVSDKVSKKYDLGDAPFLVAVGLHDRFCYTSQIIRGLYGVDTIDDVSTESQRRRSLFGGGENTRVSAVATLEVRPWETDPAALLVWDHPASSLPWPDHLLPTGGPLDRPLRPGGLNGSPPLGRL